MTALAAPTTDRQTFLRRVLFVDAATCVATGALLRLDAGPLAPMLGLSAALLFWSGLSLFPSPPSCSGSPRAGTSQPRAPGW